MSKYDAKMRHTKRNLCKRPPSHSAMYLKGKTKLTVSWHTPNRVNIKQQFPHILNFLTSEAYSECDFKV